MEVICLQDSAFYTLIEKVVERIKQTHGIKEDKWISGEEAMQKLRITSKTTLQKLRDAGKIRFSQPEKKLILYDVDSINEYLAKHAQNTF
ncbi:MAG TPA: DNA-binding protein [Chryseobacterium sp.]|nr:DNA-binding protein [Chryseobacterium sp.]